MSFKIYPLAKICKTIKHGKVGDIGDFVCATADLVLGEGVHIATGAKLVGKGTVYIGDNTQIAPNVVIYTSIPNLKKESHGRYDPKTEILIGDVHIGKNVFIGANAVISEGVTIQDDVVIRAGSYIGRNKEIYK